MLHSEITGTDENEIIVKAILILNMNLEKVFDSDTL